MLRGSLDDFKLQDILWLVSRAENTGELAVVRPSGTGRMFFRSGNVYCAESDLCREDIGRVLVRRGALGADELAAAQEEASSSNRTLGQVLLSSESIDHSQLGEAFQTQIEDAAWELIRRDFGEFSWQADVKAEPEFSLELGVAELIDAARRRAGELERIRRVIPSESSLVSIAPSPNPEDGEIKLSVEEWRLLSLVDGRSSAADIGREAGLNDLTVMGMLEGLVTRGLLDVKEAARPARPQAPPPPADVAQPFDVYFVCTGNRIRSPLAAAFLKGSLPGMPLKVASVGIGDSHPHPAEPEAIEAAAQLGADLTAHRSRSISEIDLSNADLVVGFERRHLARALEVGARPERCFSIVELVELLESIESPVENDPAARAREAVARAHDRRRLTDSVPAKVDIVDPMGASRSSYQNTAIRLRDLSRRLATGLFGVSEL